MSSGRCLCSSSGVYTLQMKGVNVLMYDCIHEHWIGVFQRLLCSSFTALTFRAMGIVVFLLTLN